MSEFDYEVREKKSVASGARRRVNGSKSKRCTLPSDYLTAAQKRELNGECYTVNLNEQIGWIELLSLPLSMAKEYIEHLHGTHMAPITGAAEMFGFDVKTYRQYLKKIGVEIPRSAGRRSRDVEETWRAFRQLPAPQEEKKPEPPKPAHAQPMQPVSMSITLTGDLEQLAAYIKLLPMDGRLRMTVTLEREVRS